MRYKAAKTLYKSMVYLVLTAGAITTILPFLWMILTSLKKLVGGHPDAAALLPKRLAF